MNWTDEGSNCWSSRLSRVTWAAVLMTAPLLTSCGPSSPEEQVLTQDGIAGLVVATDSVYDVQQALDVEFLSAGQTEDCVLHSDTERGVAVVTTAAGMNLAFVIEDPRLRTQEGVGVGSTIDEVTHAYGDLVTVTDWPSQTTGPIVMVSDQADPAAEVDERTRLYGFDTDAELTVTRVRIGMWPWVGYTDYCSDQASRPAGTGWPLTR